MSEPSPDSSRRDFLAGKSLKNEVEAAAAQVGDALVEGTNEASLDQTAPASGPTVRLGTRAMACDFHVMLNAGEDSTLETWHASDALNLVHLLEDQMTVYRETSDLLEINRLAVNGAAHVEERLFELLREARRISQLTGGAFDPTSQPVVSLWRKCREDLRVPEEAELAAVLDRVGMEHVDFGEAEADATTGSGWGHGRKAPPHPDPLPLKGERGLLRAQTVRFAKPGVELNLNGIGKGYALDRAAELLAGAESGYEIKNWLLHGGHSSVLAQGEHFLDGPAQKESPGGWPVGVRNPLFPDQRLATIVLRDEAMGTSGSGVQFFRVGGKRYGHVLDPRTGWPVDHLLSVTVLADSAGWKYPAAAADALATAFFVMGLEKAAEFCQNRSDVRALLIPPPRRGRMLEPVVCGIPDEDLFFTPDTSSP
ncbi:MAG: FAD:protein FMN transferase [Planctomycetes bacterium]|nr:FAD:protein FMN transferase [Planctomycetota bacterium]